MSVDKLSSDQLNKVSGGYTEDDILLNTYNKNIECPYCHTKEKDNLIPDVSTDILDPGNYLCKKCQRHFTVDPA